MMETTEELSYVLDEDGTNATVLPSRKKKSEKAGKVKVPPKKVLSKKELKRVEKLKDQRHKRTVRKDLLEGLKQLEIPTTELNQYESIRALSSKRKKLGKRSEERKTDGYSEGSEEETKSDESDAEEEEVGVSSSQRLMPSVSYQPAPSVVTLKPSTPKQSEPKKQKFDEITVLSSKQPAETVKSEPTVFVPVSRTPEIEEFRSKLPIITEEAAVIEAVRDNHGVIICGETGSGKTTQVPQFLYEAGFTANSQLIGITEPRRMAAISMAKRVAVELNVSEDICSYQIRFEGNVTERTKIKFMTDGVLLRELKEDFLLQKYSVIVVDEAHERSMYSDILIGLLSRIGPLRKKRNFAPLKLVIMSATLRIDDFRQTKLFKQLPPVIHIPSRQFPVTVYFNKATPDDYIEAAYAKVAQIHKLLPEGGILVFVPGQQDVWQLVQRLRQRFPFDSQPAKLPTGKRKDVKKAKKVNKKAEWKDKVANLDLSDYKVDMVASSEAPDFNETGAMENLSDEQVFNEEITEADSSAGPLHVLPLYSMLPTAQQQRVFDSPPVGCRLCIISTNVAETSLTIPNVKYVVDTGKEKNRQYDCVTGVSRFVVQWVSKASANQRSGRAGRTGPGFCYRLYSSAVFNLDFTEFSIPEIVSKPADELVLQMKNMGITHVDRFPFPSAPDAESIVHAENRLLKLGALEVCKTVENNQKSGADRFVTRVTPLGATLGKFPLLPRFGKILALSHQQNLMPYAICIVSALSVREPLVNLTTMANSSADDDESGAERLKEVSRLVRVRRIWADQGQSLLLGDLSVLLKAVGAAEFEDLRREFCDLNGLRFNAMVEIRKMRKQLTDIFNLIYTEAESQVENQLPPAIQLQLPPPSDAQLRLLRQMILTGLCENVARRKGDVAKGGAPYQRPDMEEGIFIHPSSVLFRLQPEFVVYVELVEGREKKLMFNVMAVEPEWLVTYAAAYCSCSAPLESPAPHYDSDRDCVVGTVEVTFGPSAWRLPNAEVPYPADMNYYRLFGRDLLEGKVVEKLQKYRRHLLASPESLMKPWSKGQPKIVALLSALATKEVKSRRDLEALWQEDRNFLFSEVSAWIPESLHGELLPLWPPV